MWGPGQGGIVAPGSIAATPVEAPVDIEEGMPVEVPLVYYYGHVSPADNPELYKFLVERLASLLDRRAEAWPSALAQHPFQGSSACSNAGALLWPRVAHRTFWASQGHGGASGSAA